MVHKLLRHKDKKKNMTDGEYSEAHVQTWEDPRTPLSWHAPVKKGHDFRAMGGSSLQCF
jgi:hypothetical protein